MTMAKTVPNTSVWAVPTVGVLVSGPVPVVKMSMSCWMRWSGLSIGSIDEPPPVVGITVEPVAGEPVGEPHPPPDDEPLHQIHVEQVADDVGDSQADEDQDRSPKAADRSVFRGSLACERGLQRRELVVGLIAEQHAEAHVDHHRQQQHAQERPRRNALSALEIVTGDAPELPAPRGVAGEQGQHRPPCPPRR